MDLDDFGDKYTSQDLLAIDEIEEAFATVISFH
jgi:hypothetical protein